MKVYLSLGIAASFLVLTITSAAQTARRAPARPVHKAAPSAANQALRQRVETYYRYIQEDKKSEALAMVAPESRDKFFNTDYHTLVAFRIKAVQLEKTGATATVEVVRSERIPPFLQALNFPVKDTWRRVNGRWFLVLSKPSENASPFGPMHSAQPSTSGSAAPAQLPNQGPKVTPQQALAALQKAMAKQGKTLPLQAVPAKRSTVKKPATPKNNGTSQDKSKPSSVQH